MLFRLWYVCNHVLRIKNAKLSTLSPSSMSFQYCNTLYIEYFLVETSCFVFFLDYEEQAVEQWLP